MPIKLVVGDSRQLIHELVDKSIDCVMTSPPYWGLRDYGHSDQIGLEKTPEEYLKTMLDLFDNIKLKLKDEGNCFVNLGDSYYGGPSNSKDSNLGNAAALDKVVRIIRQKHEVLQSKSLCMIPQRFAWGMIERGWILRNEIIWAKPNHMPESVTDRLTKSHEVIYHFVKQQKYYYDLDAIREKPITQDNRKYGIIRGKTLHYNSKFGDNVCQYGGKFNNNDESESFGSPRARTQRHKHSNNNCRTTSCLHDGRNPLDVHHVNGKNPGDVVKINELFTAEDIINKWKTMHPEEWNSPNDVWNISTQPYPESHFAVFPIELIRRPILAGCPIGGTVLDPFGGSGTVGEFCRNNERNAILFELNPEYSKLIKDRAMINNLELTNWCTL